MEGRERETGYYDSDAGAYDQLTFVYPSVVENANWRTSAAMTHAEVSARRTTHFIWTCEEYKTPIPLGRYGQPYFSGSAWEDFNPVRLWKDIWPGKVHRGDELWRRLAEEAAKLPFEFRSDAQRIVVSEAHKVRVGNDPRCRFVLPLPGEVPEIDIWHQCVNNALYMPLAVRRQYSYDKAARSLVREWDAGDLGIYVIMRACGPGGEKRRDKERRKQGEGDGRTVAASWTDLFRKAVAQAGRETPGVQPPPQFTTPRRYNGEDDASAVYRHLLSCGFAQERMSESGDVYAYVVRMETLDAEFQKHRAAIVAEGLARGSDELDAKEVVALAKCRMEMQAGRLPAGRPVVRCKVKEKDPLGKEILRLLEHGGRKTTTV